MTWIMLPPQTNPESPRLNTWEFPSLARYALLSCEPYSEATSSWDFAGCCGRERAACLLATAKITHLSPPQTSGYLNPVDPGFKWLETDVILEAHFKEEYVKLKIEN